MPRPTSKTTLRAPALPSDLAPHALTRARLDGAELERVRLEACDLSNEVADRVRFDAVHVSSGSLAATKIRLLSWVDVLCERCDLSMCEWHEAKLTRVEARACRMTGAKLTEADLDEVRFVDCHLDYASFSEARLRAVVFEGCRLKEADFTGADLTGAQFVRCDLGGADFTGATLRGTDVSTSTLADLRLRAADVRGLVVNRDQAAVLAELLGIVVRD